MVLLSTTILLPVHTDNGIIFSPAYSMLLLNEPINNDTMKMISPRNQVPSQKQNEEYSVSYFTPFFPDMGSFAKIFKYFLVKHKCLAGKCIQFSFQYQ